MRLFARIPLVLCALCFRQALWAGDDVGLVQESYFAQKIIPAPLYPDTFWERFHTAFDRRSGRLFASRLHSLNFTRWLVRFHDGEDDGDREIRGRIDNAALGALSRSFAYSGREVLAETEIYFWLEERHRIIANLFRDSVGGVDEEELDTFSVSYQAAERSWFADVARSSRLLYGIRPFRTSPYAYASARIRHHNETISLLHVRYHFDHFQKHRIETGLSFPLYHGLALDVGFSASLTGYEDARERLGVRLVKHFRSGTVFFVGAESLDTTRVTIGFTASW